MDKIKLVIWDLDETFWKGTLSEEGIIPIQENIRIVKELTDRGIINSIVSKNDFSKAKSKLIELGVWEYFIFPCIEWSPKGPLIKTLIEKTQLREQNVLFIDDNHLNLQEAKFYNTKLNVKAEKFIPKILEHKSLQGKSDITHKRLKQYKILEEKDSERGLFQNNIEFLESSNINVYEINGKDLYQELDRIEELLNRTNQLNFTKIRIDKGEIKELIESSKNMCGAIYVQDRFGDYGLVGFYSKEEKSNMLKHFVFSCRILNLGVEQYLYSKLGFPDLDIVPDVAIELDSSTPHWINHHSGKPKEKMKEILVKKSKTIFFKGGCDLSQMLFYLKNNGLTIIEETNYVAKNNFPIHQEHTSVLLDALKLDEKIKTYAIESNFIPFVDENFYTTKLFDSDCDVVLYSVLMDYTNEVYKHKELDLQVPFGGYSGYLTDDSQHLFISEKFNKKGLSFSTKDLKRFTQHFNHIGQIQAKDFIKNLEIIRESLPKNIPIIFLNGAEIDSPSSSETHALMRHKLMNRALEDFIKSSENCYLLDVRKIVNSKDKIVDNIRHYKRNIYKSLAEELLQILINDIKLEIKPGVTDESLIKKFTYRMFNSLKEKLRAIKSQ